MQQLAAQRFPFFQIFLVCMALLIQWFITDAHLLVIQTVFVASHLISFTGLFYVHYKVIQSNGPPPKGKEWPVSCWCVCVRANHNVKMLTPLFLFSFLRRNPSPSGAANPSLDKSTTSVNPKPWCPSPLVCVFLWQSCITFGDI